MALAPLATVADLSARSADAGDHVKADTALAVASSAIREAAESAISAVTATVTVSAPSGRLLALPGLVRDVTAVTVDGAAVTDFQAVGNGLWRRNGWAAEPVPVTVTATFGTPAVPEDIIDMTCQLAISWLRHADEGGGSTAGLSSAAIDDAREGYTDEAAGQVSPVFIPKATRDWLASRFGGGASVVETA